MNPGAIRTAGRLLFGPCWRTPFVHQFGIGDATLRRMMKNERAIPPGLARDIETALRDRANEIDALLETLIDAPAAIESLVYRD